MRNNNVPVLTSKHRKESLSVIVITKNEADRISACLASVANWADEIIVLDSGSEDATVNIAKQYTSQVFITDWPGYGPQKQRALEKAAGIWVLSIDADEQVSPALQQEIDNIISRSPSEVGFKTPWAVMLYGERLDYGRSGRAPLRLFKRKGAKFSDAQVHEHIILPPGTIGKTKGRLLHYTHRDFKHGIDKFSVYSWIWAQQRYQKGCRTGLLNALFHALWMFTVIYIFRLGVLDGRRGFLMAVLYSQYTFNKYAALWSLTAKKG
ncbi:MAG: glycosyltransferase family 2 protein [Gammaproteobacteria bacterium]|nr:glycosyltransferase family 2 protein [Gammaproteobacteria bacterium]